MSVWASSCEDSSGWVVLGVGESVATRRRTGRGLLHLNTSRCPIKIRSSSTIRPIPSVQPSVLQPVHPCRQRTGIEPPSVAPLPITAGWFDSPLSAILSSVRPVSSMYNASDPRSPPCSAPGMYQTTWPTASSSKRTQMRYPFQRSDTNYLRNRAAAQMFAACCAQSNRRAMTRDDRSDGGSLPNIDTAASLTSSGVVYPRMSTRRRRSGMSTVLI